MASALKSMAANSIETNRGKNKYVVVLQISVHTDNNPIINFKDTFFEPAVGSRPHFNRM